MPPERHRELVFSIAITATSPRDASQRLSHFVLSRQFKEVTKMRTCVRVSSCRRTRRRPHSPLAAQPPESPSAAPRRPPRPRQVSTTGWVAPTPLPPWWTTSSSAPRGRRPQRQPRHQGGAGPRAQGGAQVPRDRPRLPGHRRAAGIHGSKHEGIPRPPENHREGMG